MNFSWTYSGSTITATDIGTNGANVLTVTCSNSFQTGNTVVLSGTGEAFLNGQTVTVLAAGLSSSQFRANFTHANYTNASDTGTANLNFSNNHLLVEDYGPQVFSPFVDTTSTYSTGGTTAVSTSSFTPNFAADALFMAGASNSSNTLPAMGFLTQATSGTGSNGNFLQFQAFLGQGVTIGSASGFVTAPYSFTGTLSGTADWITVLIGVETTSPEFVGQGDTVETSPQVFQQFKELYFQGDIFLEGYVGLLFMKNVFMLPRDYWDKALSTPYSGQLFPVGPGEGGPGQVYPY